MTRLLRSALFGSALLLPAASTHAVSFVPLGDIAGGPFFSTAQGVSSDGSVAVGSGIYEGQITDSNSEAFRWTRVHGLQGLGDLSGGHFTSAAYDASEDGSIVVGVGRSDAGDEAALWSAADGWQNLGDLAGGSVNARAFAVSADGSVVVGRGSSDPGHEAFVWDATNGMRGLGDFEGGSFYSTANGISADGSIVVGQGTSASGTNSLGTEAFVWDAANGMQGLGDLAGGDFLSVANAVSADGSVVVGRATSEQDGQSKAEAFLWDAVNGMRGLGDLPGGNFASRARGVSADGSVVVGEAHSASGSTPFVWDAAHGMRSLEDLLTARGVDLTGWDLEVATDVSANGSTIVGYGRNPDGQTEAFLAAIPEPSTAVLLGGGLAALALRGRRR